eukprot:2667696-Pyramimonas_sp.AAC.1
MTKGQKQAHLMEWLKKSLRFKGYFDTYDGFRYCRATKNKLDSLGIWSEFETYMNAHCCFSDHRLSNNMAFFMFDQVMSQLAKMGLMKMAVHVLKFAVPTNDGVPWLLQGRADAKKLVKLACVMTESKAFQASRAAASKDEKEANEAKEPKKKKQKKAARSELVKEATASGQEV